MIEPFVTRGSFHMLADEVRIGWHPLFLEFFSTTKLEAAAEGSGDGVAEEEVA